MSAAETLERAITIHQPWAWAVAAGHKPVENRTWRPPLEAVGKLIGIHAGMMRYFPGAVEWDAATKALGNVEIPPEPLTVGALIGVARLVGVLRECRMPLGGGGYELMRGASVGEPVRLALRDRIRPWWRGPWGWLLEEAVLLPEPIPMRGQQGLWRIPLGVHGEKRPPVPQSPPWATFERSGTASEWALEQWRKARETR